MALGALQVSLFETLADTAPGTVVFCVTVAAATEVEQPLLGLVTVTV